MKGCPYDNVVSESTYKLIKTEFVRQRSFLSIKQLKIQFDQYMRWFNEKWIHSTLGYLSPTQYKSLALSKVV